MPATTCPAGFPSEPLTDSRYFYAPLHWPEKPTQVSNHEEMLSRSCPSISYSVTQCLQSSFKPAFAYHSHRTIYSASNGFVHSCIKAYFEHLHLVIRPDDVWISILTKLNMYIQANSEALRSKFVAFQVKQFLEIRVGGHTDNLHLTQFVQDMTLLMQEIIVDKELREWVLPDFTTTTENDLVVASVVFMGARSKYFDYGGRTSCGLPSVTVTGEQGDWEIILEKLEKLKALGDEPTQWYELLVPVIKGFIKTFTHPGSDSTRDFWGCIVHHDRGGSGQPNWYSGWITAFTFWNERGDRMYKETAKGGQKVQRLTLDGIQYHRITTNAVTPGWVNVDVQIDDTGNGNGVYITTLVAGSTGMDFKASGHHDEKEDTVSPMMGWWAYLKRDPEGADSKTTQPIEKMWGDMDLE